MLAKLTRGRVDNLLLGFTAAAVFGGLLLGYLVSRADQLLIILGGLVGILVFLGILTSLESGLLLLIFLTYTRASDIAIHYHGAPSVARGFIFLLFLAILIRWFLFSEQPKGWIKPLILLGLYGLVGIASLLYAASPQRVEGALQDYVKDALIAILIVVLLQRAALLRNVIWTLLAAGIFIGTLSVLQYLTGNFGNNYWGFAQAEWMNIVGSTNGYRLSGPIGDPNFFAQIMVVLVPLGLERMLNERKPILRFLAGWSMLVSAASVVFTFSRGGFLALTIMLVPAIFLFRRRFIYLPIVLAIGAILLTFIPTLFTERVFALQDVFITSPNKIRSQDYSLRGRASENLAGWLMFRDHPILGVGWKNFPVYYPQYAEQIGLAPEVGERAAHNLYLEIAAESGILGLLAFALILGTVAKSLQTAYARFRQAGSPEWAGIVFAFGIGFLGYLVAAFFVHAAYPRFFYLLVGIAIAMPAAAKDYCLRKHPA